MGLLRFLLAMLVMLSHTGITVAGLNPGVASVVVFYAISGYVMSALIAKHFSQPGQAAHFYIDRVARIYPQYLFYAVAAAILFWVLGPQMPFMQRMPSGVDVANNLLIVPLNFFMFNQADQFTLVPPAWSLGAEVLFYLLAPWLWRYGRYAFWAAVFSLVIQILAWHQVLNTDAWGYRLLPGVLWIFLTGMALQKHEQSHAGLVRRMVLLAPLGSVLAYVYLSSQALVTPPYTREVLLGFGLAVPAIYLLKNCFKRDGLGYAVDQTLGNLSYGIFLNHFFCFWLLGLPHPESAFQWLVLVLASIGLSYCTQRFLERPCVIWRQKRREAWQLATKPLKIDA
jgi:peptidoglycan/LPS O-acetylase OafA/YrhL